MTVCAQCGKEVTTNPKYWIGKPYCTRECRHAAGDRSACLGWDCGCTKYAKKRRLLREHRNQMRIMDSLISDCNLRDELQERIENETDNTGFWLGYDLQDELEERIEAETGNTGFWLGYDDDSEGLDESSDKEDPEKTLRKEIDDKSHFLEAASSYLCCDK